MPSSLKNGLALGSESWYNMVVNYYKVADGDMNEKCRVNQQRISRYQAQADSQPHTGVSYCRQGNPKLRVISRLWRRCAGAIGFRFMPISGGMVITTSRPRTILRPFSVGYWRSKCCVWRTRNAENSAPSCWVR